MIAPRGHGGYVLRQHYAFMPPIVTNCMLATGTTPDRLERKSFRRGQFVDVEENGTLVFQGVPDGEPPGRMYFFYVAAVEDVAGSSRSEKISPPGLKIVPREAP
ncbi:MAG: hypothetical protein HY457_03705 [Parcubacteria group bacterium]|nr:hypothetical protein [Parcubacteria group bacterium]